MPNFIRVCKASDVPEGGKLLVEAEDQFVVVFHVGGQFYAIDDCCTHDGGPLSDGRLVDHVIACPRHGATFDIRTGRVLSMPATQDTRAYEVKIEGDDVWVKR